MTNPETIICPQCLGSGEVIATGKGSTFLAFWEHYPKKVAKGDAERAHKRAIDKIRGDKGMTRTGASEFLVEKCKEFSAAVRVKDLKFVCHPATWLNGKRWDDDPAMWVGDEHTKADRLSDMSKKAHDKQVQGFKDAEKSAATQKEKAEVFGEWKAAQYRKEKGL